MDRGNLCAHQTNIFKRNSISGYVISRILNWNPLDHRAKTPN